MTFIRFNTITKRFPGVLTPDDVSFEVARKLGIAMVHQELAFCPNLTVAENLRLGDLSARPDSPDTKRKRLKGRKIDGRKIQESDWHLLAINFLASAQPSLLDW